MFERTKLRSDYWGHLISDTVEPLESGLPWDRRKCPDLRGCSVHKQGAWDTKTCPVQQGVLISGVLIRGFPLYILIRELPHYCITIAFNNLSFLSQPPTHTPLSHVLGVPYHSCKHHCGFHGYLVQRDGLRTGYCGNGEQPPPHNDCSVASDTVFFCVLHSYFLSIIYT